VVGDGFVNTPSNTATTWFLKSTDGGQHWTPPVQLDSPHSAYTLPAAIGGPQAGQLAIGYFRTINGKTDPNDTSDVWTYSTAESTNANGAGPTFAYGDVNPGYAYHTGEICNLGILCGTVPGGPSDRSLLDFTSVTLDSSGCPLYVFAGNTPQSEAAGQTWNFVTRQTTGCFSTTSTSPKPKRHAKPHRRPRKRATRHRRHGRAHHRHGQAHHRRAADVFAG
jgi:hypothetical protein